MEQRQQIGQYVVLEELGRGTRTVVYKGWQPSAGRHVAIKVLRKYDEEAVRRFEAEARLIAGMRNPYVRQVFEAGQTPEGHFYVVMQYVDNSLKQLMRKRFAQHHLFTPDEVARLLGPVANVLDDLHRHGMVHLDVKPENILLSGDGQTVLADFGSVRRQGECSREGTPRYMSPEQAGSRPVEPRSDVYSLACVVYEMLAGRPPFQSEIDLVLIRQHLQDPPPPLRSLNREVSRDLEKLVLSALSKESALRPRSAGEFIAQITRSGAGSVRKPARKKVPGPKTARRRAWTWLLLLLALLLCLLLAAGAFFALRPLLATTFQAGPATAATIVVPTLTLRATAATTRPPATPAAPTAQAHATTTPRPSSTPEPTATATSSATPAPAVAQRYAAGPIPYEPANESRVQGIVAFSWVWDNPLQPDERFRIRMWAADGSTVFAATTQDRWRHSGPPGPAGRYTWAVDVVQVNDQGQVLGALSPTGPAYSVIWE